MCGNIPFAGRRTRFCFMLHSSTGPGISCLDEQTLQERFCRAQGRAVEREGDFAGPTGRGWRMVHVGIFLRVDSRTLGLNQQSSLLTVQAKIDSISLVM